MSEDTEVELKPLGRTDIRVSAVGLGVMTFGAKTSEPDAFRQLDMASASQLEKAACGAFSDISFVPAGKKRGFCRLRSITNASPTGCWRHQSL